MKKQLLGVFTMVALLAGCASSYSWKSNVPHELRSVSVPTFRNESSLMEIGSICTRQILREFQREGTFKITSADDAVLEIQGVVKSVGSTNTGYNRANWMRLTSADMSAVVEVSVIDKRDGKVLINNRVYKPTVSLVALQDMTTAERDASGRLADELSRMVVDDVCKMKW